MSDINKRSLGDTVSGLWTMARGGRESAREENRRCKSRGPGSRRNRSTRFPRDVAVPHFPRRFLHISTPAGFRISAFVRVPKTGFVLSASSSAETNDRRDFLPSGRLESARGRTLLSCLMNVSETMRQKR